MPEKQYPVLQPFRHGDKKTGTFTSYEPGGKNQVFTVPPGLSAEEARELVEWLQAGAGGCVGPLIGQPLPDKKSSSSAPKEN